MSKKKLTMRDVAEAAHDAGMKVQIRVDDEHSKAKDHWDYIAALLREHGESDAVILKIGFHYQTAFIHGYKHGKSEAVAP